MGRSFRLTAGSVFAYAACAAVLASGCGSKREVLATDHQNESNASDFGGGDAGEPPPVSPDAGTAGLCPSNQCPEGRTTCPNNPFPCAVDLLSDDDNCGACGVFCPRESAYMTEYYGFTRCVAGTCRRTCLVARADCNGLPEDGCETKIDNNKDNCGGCGIQCADVCIDGKCGCPAPQTFCPATSSCKNLQRDNQNCGECGNACPPSTPPPPTWGAQRGCLGGECGQLSCIPNRYDCDGDLGDEDGNGCEVFGATDPNNCGGCGIKCDPGQTCVGGKCLCGPGEVLCGSTTLKCAQVGNDIDNCGVCSYQCPGDRRSLAIVAIGFEPDPAHGRPTCTTGVCGYRCSPNWSDCDGDIKNGCETSLLDDPLNCGGCGVRCDAIEGQACVNGQCAMKPCEVH